MGGSACDACVGMERASASRSETRSPTCQSVETRGQVAHCNVTSIEPHLSGVYTDDGV